MNYLKCVAVCTVDAAHSDHQTRVSNNHSWRHDGRWRIRWCVRCKDIIWRMAPVHCMKIQRNVTSRYISLQWRHIERDDISNHQPHDCLLNRLFRRRSKKTSKLCITGLCAGNLPVTREFPAQRAIPRKYFHLMTSSCINDVPHYAGTVFTKHVYLVKGKCDFDRKKFVTGCIGSWYFGIFRCSLWRKWQHAHISVILTFEKSHSNAPNDFKIFLLFMRKDANCRIDVW